MRKLRGPTADAEVAVVLKRCTIPVVALWTVKQGHSSGLIANINAFETKMLGSGLFPNTQFESRESRILLLILFHHVGVLVGLQT